MSAVERFGYRFTAFPFFTTSVFRNVLFYETQESSQDLNIKTYLRFLTGDMMVSITVSVPEETKKLMKEHEEMNWSGFVKKAIQKKAEQLKKLESLKKQLEEEHDVVDWSVKLQRASRSGRLDALKKKGLL